VYSLDVSEATTRGTKIGDILAVDEDEGVNGVVTYSVISDWANDVFNIDPHTGDFSLTGKLDYEEVSVVQRWTRWGGVDYVDRKPRSAQTVS